MFELIQLADPDGHPEVDTSEEGTDISPKLNSDDVEWQGNIDDGPHDIELSSCQASAFSLFLPFSVCLCYWLYKKFLLAHNSRLLQSLMFLDL